MDVNTISAIVESGFRTSLGDSIDLGENEFRSKITLLAVCLDLDILPCEAMDVGICEVSLIDSISLNIRTGIRGLFHDGR